MTLEVPTKAPRLRARFEASLLCEWGRVWNMALGLSIDKLLYLFFHCPSHVQTCFLTANCSFATLPLNATATLPFARSSPMKVMHTTRSLLFAFLGFLLFGWHSDASAILPRRFSNASSSVYNTRSPNVAWDNDLWRVTTTALDQGHYQSRQSVANGYIGRRSGAATI